MMSVGSVLLVAACIVTYATLPMLACERLPKLDTSHEASVGDLEVFLGAAALREYLV